MVREKKVNLEKNKHEKKKKKIRFQLPQDAKSCRTIYRAIGIDGVFALFVYASLSKLFRSQNKSNQRVYSPLNITTI